MSATRSPLPPSPLVYVVDDEPASAEVIAELLQLEGYQTRVFVDSRVAAQELAKADVKPDVLLADYLMPGLNGLELIARGKAEAHSLRTVLMTGFTANHLPPQINGKPDLCLTKPFAMEKLLKSVRLALDANH